MKPRKLTGPSPGVAKTINFPPSISLPFLISNL